MIRSSELLLNFIINAAWQITAIALVATALARILNNAPARFRHLLWVGAFFLSVALPVWTLPVTKTEGSPRQTVNRIAAQATALASPKDTSNKQDMAGRVSAGGPIIQSRANLGRLFERRIQQFSTGPTAMVLLTLGYLLFILYRFGRLWRFWQRTASLTRSGYQTEMSPSMIAVAERCCSAFRLKQVPIMCTTLSSTPGVVGGRQPMVVLPQSLFGELPAETLYSILGHEMAHIARRDFQWNVVYEILWLPISFHPLAGFLKKQIEKTRELACDEMVTEKLLAPVVHARSLIRIAGVLINPAAQALTLGIFDGNILEERIMKLTCKTRRLGARSGRLLTLSAVALLCLSCFAISMFSIELRAAQAQLAAVTSTGNDGVVGAALQL
ncbi:MAG TPA: M56 family metallopeptidase, partial [Pyrinomonadaceae bacterium]|nr:M56 family metallopeptidase [Pyrinomonadaceae bacterium]